MNKRNWLYIPKERFGSGGGTIISFRNNVFTGNGTDGSPLLSTSLK